MGGGVDEINLGGTVILMSKNILGWLGANWLAVVAISMVTVALVQSDLPFAYFQLMNWVVVGAAILVVMRVHNAFIMWVFISAAVIFNPLAPIFLRSDIWQIADIAVVACFFMSLFIPIAKK